MGPMETDGDDEPEETVAVRLARQAGQPTEAEVDAHAASGHAVFRSWCRTCVMAKGVGQQHRRVDHEGESMSVVAFDYGFMSASDEETANPITILVAHDRQTRSVLGVALPRKGGTAHAVDELVGFIRRLGYKRLAVRCDQEEAALSLRRAVRAGLGEVEVIEEMSPVMDHQANGAVENAVKRVKAQACTLI
eukprot:4702272-Amphidinium_carterae.1